ncbi:DUF6907 domain-containing protein [Streptosporangium sp. NPDC050855]|uniref:DUF6907 domain-containing protein n=1 Tax=Streptosporangium sp. NPDC050855 TaxID=3366194 RepID=UPI0037ADB421
MDNRTITTPATASSAANLRTRSTGTIHASTTPGNPLCPARSDVSAIVGRYDETSDPITCRSCLKQQAKLQPTQAVEPPAVAEQPSATRPIPACPAWCSEDHRNDDPHDLWHWSSRPHIPLRFGTYLSRSAGGELIVDLMLIEDGQTPNVPVVVLADETRTWQRNLTSEEADQLAHRLRELAEHTRTGQPSEPVPVKGRPFWQTAPCPAWCEALHRDKDHPGDRGHYGELHITPLTQHRPVQAAPGVWEPDELHLFLIQDEREAAPLVRVGRGGLTEQLVTMTLAEAAQHQARLGAVLGAAQQSQPGTPMAGCRPWCVEHDDCTGGSRHPADPSGGMCRAGHALLPGGRGGVGGVVELTYDGVDGALIQVSNDSDAVLTLAEAEHFAHTILERVALARTTTPASPAPMVLADIEGACPSPGCRICKPA